MCVVSMIGDHYQNKWQEVLPKIQQPWPGPFAPIGQPTPFPNPQISREEFEALRKDVLEMKELLKRAVKYDEDNGQPHCEQDEKIAVLKKMAELFDISLDDVFK